jgi:hypothetical protein
MKKLLFLILPLAFVTGEVSATPALQHRVQGVVRLVDQERHLIVIAPDAKEEPTEFVVEEKRTRLRCDGTPVMLSGLTVGQRVRLYFKQERGHSVATEVTWQSTEAVQPRSMKGLASPNSV